jgi:hypothetical protein
MRAGVLVSVYSSKGGEGIKKKGKKKIEGIQKKGRGGGIKALVCLRVHKELVCLCVYPVVCVHTN